MLRQVQLRWIGHLVRMDDERLHKRLFYGDVATGAHQQGVQKRRYKDTLEKSLKQLQINPVTWQDFAQDRPAWRRSVKTGSAIYEAKRITATKAKRAAESHQHQNRRCQGPFNIQALSTHLSRANQHGRTSSDAMHHQSDNSNLYIKFCQPSFSLPHHQSWHQFNYSH
ncbi:unnamed protein product [Schistocephalus solidus]|uniref:Uncharacterized protein n=1 Tax=Schistocephalus solidus TaxID=70667 RepID=A0A183T7B2_SCHSO|nr:unnamed protein product [Schistocephalus solidus]